MGKLTPSFKKALFDEMYDNIASNTSHYYAFVSAALAANVSTVANNDYSVNFINDWTMLFGKKINPNDIVPVVSKNLWANGTVYRRYDNISNTTYSNSGFYVVSAPVYVGGAYHFYKCIDNADGSYSTVDPGSHVTPSQPTTFTTADNYKWRYVGSVSGLDYRKFATDDFIPAYANASLAAAASSYCGVEVVPVVNAGSGYIFANGLIQGFTNSTVIQIQTTESVNYFVNNGIYLKNSLATTSQLRTIVASNQTSITVNTPVNTAVLTANVTQYIISPRVLFETDGENPIAYTTIDVDANNSISNIVILDIGSNISRANAYILPSTYGTGANIYAIVPPPGGHGANPAVELDMKGFAASFSFSNSESNTIAVSNVAYNRIGILKNPYSFVSNSDPSKSTSRYSSNTFSQILQANVLPSYTFDLYTHVKGGNTDAEGLVVFSNGSFVFMVGDKNFEDGEGLFVNSVSVGSNLAINTIGKIYTKDIYPLYVQDINSVNRSDTQTETFKLVIQI